VLSEFRRPVTLTVRVVDAGAQSVSGTGAYGQSLAGDAGHLEMKEVAS
jgi:hypothetical protein